MIWRKNIRFYLTGDINLLFNAFTLFSYVTFLSVILPFFI